MTAFVEGVNAEGLLTVSQAASDVGCSENTLRRHAEGLGVEAGVEDMGRTRTDATLPLCKPA